MKKRSAKKVSSEKFEGKVITASMNKIVGGAQGINTVIIWPVN
jgi:hypothetical protein